LLRSLSLLLALSLAPTALAVPLHLQHSGRLADSSGVPLEGEHALLVTVYDGAGNALWSDTFTQEIGDGYFNVILGSGAPLSVEAFEGDDLYVGLSVDGEAELPVRFPLSSVPFAIRAGSAKDLRGGVVDATEIRVNGATVIDGSGTFVGPADDSGSLDALSCGVDQVPVFDGVDWGCGDLNAAHEHDASDITSGTLTVDRLPVGSSSEDVAAGDHAHGFGEITGQLAGSQLPTDFGSLVDSAVVDGALDLAPGTTIGGVAIVTGTAYTDDMARTAMGGKANTNALHHDRYTDPEAVTAMGAKANTNALNHDRYTNNEAVTAMGAKANTNALNHDRYTDTEARTAVASSPRVWQLFTHEGFSTGAAGWSNNGTSICDGGESRMLGGYNVFAGGTVNKTFTNLPTHTELRIVFDYNFIDSWDGESAYANIDSTRRWTQPFTGASVSLENNICGGSWGDTLKHPVEIHVAHTASSVNVLFGSSLDQAANDESWGVDNVRIYYR
jgi:hypothetical protein